MNKRVTLKDIAAATGVNISAVSGVLNKSKTGARVSEATRQLIVKTAEEMRYQPNALARSLEGHVGMFGVVLGAPIDLILHPYTGLLLQGIVDGARDSDYQPVLYTTLWEEAEANISVFCDRRSDGIIAFSPPENSTIITRLQEYGVPVVGIDLRPGTADCDQVGLDEVGAFRKAVRHLYDLGHRDIAYVTARVPTFYSDYRRDVVMGILNEFGLPPRSYVVPITLPIPRRSPEFKEFLQQPGLPTGMICFNDYIGTAIIEAAQELGMHIPGDFSVMGFDNLDEAMEVTPHMTTFWQPTRELGKEAVQMLLSLIKDGESDQRRSKYFTADLIERESTGPAPTRAQVRIA